jgi:hypothetical protein
MATLQVVLVSILGFTSCAALLLLADRSRKRRWRIALALAAIAGLVLQGALWGYVTVMFKVLSIGGSYRWLYTALGLSGAGSAWALFLVLISPRRHCTC